MPIYEYRCPSCSNEFEKIQKVNADAPPCPACGSTDAERKVSLSSFHLKGNGWYTTDYRSKSGSDSTGGDASVSSDAGTSSDGSATGTPRSESNAPSSSEA